MIDNLPAPAPMLSRHRVLGPAVSLLAGIPLGLSFAASLPAQTVGQPVNPIVPQVYPNTGWVQPGTQWQPQAPRGALNPQSTLSVPAQVESQQASTSRASQVPKEKVDSSSLAPSVLQLPAHRAVVRVGAEGLYIQAENSNLSQILRDIASATGTRVSGLAGEERIFGTYGPGEAEDVMNTLLYGSDYNVLMVGNIRAGAPRELVLTRRNNAPTSPAPSTQPRTDDDPDGGTAYEDQDAPPPANMMLPPQARAPMPPPSNANPTASPDGQVRTPQQLLEQLQQLHRQNDGAVIDTPSVPPPQP